MEVLGLMKWTIYQLLVRIYKSPPSYLFFPTLSDSLLFISSSLFQQPPHVNLHPAVLEIICHQFQIVVLEIADVREIILPVRNYHFQTTLLSPLSLETWLLTF